MNDKQTIANIIVTQLTSGRWILTVAASICLVHFAWAIEDKSKVIDIIKDIVIFYFVVKNAMPTGGSNEKVNTASSNTNAVDPNAK